MSEAEQETAEELEPGETEAEPDTETEEEEAAEEAAEPDTETEEEEAPHGLSPQEVEAVFKKVETAHKAYARKVGDAFGDEAVHLIPCPVCADTVPGFVDGRSVGHFPDDVRKQVMRFLGFAAEQDYEPSQTVHVCGPCKGKGKVTTGSTVAGHETVTCPSCKGYGYTPPPTADGSSAGGATVVPFAPAPLTEVAPRPDVDEWQEPKILPDGRENPNYGKMPHMKVLVEPWGITAGLRAEPEYVPVPGEVVQ